MKHSLYAILALIVFASANVAHGDTAPATLSTPLGEPRLAGLQMVDWIIIGLYVVLTIVIGWYFGRKQRSTSEYFVGSGSMSPFLIGVSLFASLVSTISYLSKPGEALGKGPAMLASLLCFPIVYLLVAYVLLPRYMVQRVNSAYELLETKLGLGIRLSAATMFVLMRLFWMSLLMYYAAVAITVMSGIDAKWIPLIVLVTGIVAVVYTSIGGLRAVVVTDFLQAMLLLGGALLVIATVSIKMRGFGWVPTQWHPNWDVQPLFSFDPRVRMTILGWILSVGTFYVCTAGGDQVSVQRFMATRDATTARRAFAVQLLFTSTVTILLALVGFALLGYFSAFPQQLPSGMNLDVDADRIFPYFIGYHLPVGVSGLVVAAMFAAAMSSIDSGVNSITAVVTTDFLDRFGRRPATERKHVLLARGMAFSIGVVVVVGALMIGDIPGNITAVTSKTTGLLLTPIFGFFVYAMFVPFARVAGVWIGTIVGIVTAVAIAFSGPLVMLCDLRFGIPAQSFGVELKIITDMYTGRPELMAPDPISFQWIAPIALAANLATGSLISWILHHSCRRPHVPAALGESIGRQ